LKEQEVLLIDSGAYRASGEFGGGDDREGAVYGDNK